MDIRIGIIQSNKEIELELPDGIDRDKVLKDIEKALSGDDGVLTLSDKKNRQVIIPASKIAYIEMESASHERRVGFGAY
ncbi:MAG: DUF3107 domain-containing protein [Actinobacteria bacterium]|nr:DUF3107 domain-containing protein [Actinomycetota bacterium]MCL5446050.1 DUF3107 domain-containing protein [Actinomycetota bacterium]